MSDGSAAAETRSYGRSAGLLTIALGSAGLLAYVFFALASHSLSKEDYGEIVVLWSVVFVVASTLFRPIEQLLSRTLAEREEVGEGSGHVLRVAATIQAGVTLAAVIGLLALKGPIEDNLLEGPDALYWVMIVALIGFGGSYYARGFLAGQREFGLYAALLVLEGSSRLVFALAVAIGVAEGVEVVAFGIAVAPLVSLIVMPLAIRRRGVMPTAADTGAGSGSGSGGEFTLSRGGAFAAAVLVMMLSEQVLVSSGALFVRAAEGAAAAGFIFNVMMVARAPLVLFQAIAASLLPHLTRLRTRGDPTGRDAFRMSVNTTLLAIAGFAALVTVGVLAVGPQVMEIAFGDKFSCANVEPGAACYERAELAIVAVGMGFYLSGAALNQAALAQGQARRAALCWAAVATLFVIWNLAAPLDPYLTVEVGFAGSAAVLSGLLGVLYLRPHPFPGDVLEPGSPREIEARLAAADEIG